MLPEKRPWTTIRGRIGSPGRRSAQAVVFSALSMLVVVGAGALVADVGQIYFQYVRLRSACDAAVMAGAAYLPGQTSAARKSAQSYALANGIKASEIQNISVASDSRSITLSATRKVPVMFGAVLGLSQYSVNGVSRAGVQVAGRRVVGTIPIGLDYTTPYSYGQNVTLHGGGYGPGNWGGLALGGTGSAVYVSNLTDGYPGELSIGDIVDSEPGASSGPTMAGVSARVANGLLADPTGTWNEHSLTDVRAAIVPLVDWTGCNGRCSAPLKGFAVVWLKYAVGSDIYGVFITKTAAVQTVNDAPDGGLYHVALLP